MTIDRRSFFRGLLAAPAVVAASSIMPVRSLAHIYAPRLWGDGIHDDQPAMQAMLDSVEYIVGNILYRGDGTIRMQGGLHVMGKPVVMGSLNQLRIRDCTFINWMDSPVCVDIDPLNGKYAWWNDWKVHESMVNIQR